MVNNDLATVKEDISELNSNLGEIGNCEQIASGDFETWTLKSVKPISSFKYIMMTVRGSSGASSGASFFYDTAFLPVSVFSAHTGQILFLKNHDGILARVRYDSDTSVSLMLSGTLSHSEMIEVYGIK